MRESRCRSQRVSGAFALAFVLAGCPEKKLEEPAPSGTVNQVKKDLDAAAAAIEAKTKKVDEGAAK